jgi:hypothetical protein
MKTLIFSHLYQRPGAPEQAPAALEATLAMWLDHLRGPGHYAGDIILFTNVAGISGGGITLKPYPDVPADARRAHLHRALSYHLVPTADYDVAMQMDLDLLAVGDINPLFPTDTRLWAAPSDATSLDWRHAWTLLPRWRRWSYRYSGWRMKEPGVSACVVASKTAVWEQNFGAWARMIRQHGNRPIPHLSDQSFLNLLYFEQTIAMCRWSPELIRHRDWDTADAACLFHFPCSRREHMARYQRVPRRQVDSPPSETHVRAWQPSLTLAAGKRLSTAAGPTPRDNPGAAQLPHALP